VRRLSWSFFLPAERLKPPEREQLNKLLQSEAKLAEGYDLIQSFNQLIRTRRDKELSEWLEKVEKSGLEPLKSFGRGVKRDEAAVRAGLTLRWNQGAVEGSVNRLKLVKRSMFGRANFDLLRARVLAG